MVETREILVENEIQGIQAFKGFISAEFGEQLIGIWLFGSKARGDGKLDSDLDLLVVVSTVSPVTRWRIREIAADCSLEYDILFNTHILDLPTWEKHTRQVSTFWQEIERDGLQLLFSHAASPPKPK
jgi:predicted nucleotidyltransferase